MDFEMREGIDEETQDRQWDFMIKDGKLETVDHNYAERQKAIVASFIQYGTVPQMPTFGCQWAELLTGQTTPQALHAQIRNNIMAAVGGMKFVPKFSSNGKELVVEIKEAV